MEEDAPARFPECSLWLYGGGERGAARPESHIGSEDAQGGGERALVHNLFLALVPGGGVVDPLSTHAGMPSGGVGIFRIKRWDAHF